MYCKNCGTKLPEDAAFCTVCGAQVENTPPLPADPATLPRNTHPALAQVLNKLGNEVPTIKDSEYFANAFNAVQYFAGLFSDPDGFGAWSAIYIFYGVAYAVTAVLAIYARFRLAGFRQNGPKAYLAFLCVNCALNALNLVNAIGTEIYAVSSAVSTLLTIAVMMILTNIYYKKRADLFVN